MIAVKQTAPDQFAVTVTDNGTSTEHVVTLSPGDHRRLTGARHGETALVEAAFRFLLDREPKEAILARFDLTVIARYFPQFERELPNYL